MRREEVSYAAPLASGRGRSVELAQILRCHGQAYMQAHRTSPEQRKVIRDVWSYPGYVDRLALGISHERLSLFSY